MHGERIDEWKNKKWKKVMNFERRLLVLEVNGRRCGDKRRRCFQAGSLKGG